MLKITAIIVAAGSGTRMGGVINKVFMPICGRSVIDYTIEAISECEEISNIILVTRECDILESMEHIKNNKKRVRIIKGGKTRQESVYMGLSEAKDADYVVIHDGARALITPDIIKQSISDMLQYGASAVGVPCKDTLKTIDENGFISSTIDREKTYLIQTPQNFRYEDILTAHINAIEDEFEVTDDCALYEKYFGKIKITKGSYDNIKLTTPEDMIIAEKIITKRKEAKL